MIKNEKTKLILNRVVIIFDFINPILLLLAGGFAVYKFMSMLLVTPGFLEAVTIIQQANQPEVTSYMAIRISLILILGFITPYVAVKIFTTFSDRRELIAKLKKKWNMESETAQHPSEN